MDRAVFLGDLARTARPSETQGKDPSKARFDDLLSQEVRDEEIPDKEDQADSPALPKDEADRGSQEIQDDQKENRQDAIRQSRRGQEDEAEKASAGQWRGPHLGIGLPMMGHVPQQIQTQQLEKQGRAQRQRDAADGDAEEKGVERVDDALLQALRKSGLAQPVTGFSDPRLRGGPPQLGSEWSQQEIAGGRIYRWESSPGHRQVLRWSDKESLLETTAAGQRQVLQKLGEQIWSQTTPWDRDIGFDLPKNLRPI